MAQVPTLTGQQLRTTGLPSPAIDPAAFGAGAAGLQDAAQALQSVAADAQEAEDRRIRTTAMQRDVEFMTFDREQRFGDNGLFRKAGQEALNAQPTVEAAYAAKRAELLASAGTQREKDVVTELLDRRFQSSLDSIAQFGTQQSVVALRGAADTRLTKQADRTVAALRMGDPKEAEQSILELRAAAHDRARIAGLGPEGIARAEAEAGSGAFRSAISAHLDAGEWDKARTMWSAHAADLTEDDRAQLAGPIRRATIREVSALIGRSAVDAANGPVAGVTMTKASPALLAALTARESGGNPAAESPVGASGLRQIMPGTFRALASRFGVDATGMTDDAIKARLKTDTELNLKMGEAYLNDQLKAFGGDVVLALAAYNAGPGRVQEWVKRFGKPGADGKPASEWVKRIPFAETRAYVQNILLRAGVEAQTAELPDLATVRGQARADAERRFPGDIEMADAAETAAERHWQDLSGERRARQAEADDRIQPYLQNPTVDSPDDIPASVWAGLDPSKRTQYTEEFARRSAVTSRMARVEAGQPINPTDAKDKAAVDAFYLRTSAGWVNMTPQQQAQRAVQFAARYGVMPESIEGRIVGGLRSTDPRQRLAAAELYGQMRAANPGLVNGFSAPDAADANFLLEYQRRGLRPEEATTALTTVERLGAEELKARDQAFAAALGPKQLLANNTLLRLAGADATVRAEGGFFENQAGSPAIPPEMTADFVAVARANYRRLGDVDAAMAAAYDQVRRVWAPSAFNGSRRFMKNAPEAVYGVPAMTASQNAKWMQEQARAQAGGDGDLQVIEAPGRRAADGRPVYFLMRQVDGVLKPVAGPNGNVQAWRPDWQTSPEYLRRERAARKRRSDAMVQAPLDREALDAEAAAAAARSAADPLVNMQGGA